MFNKYVYVTQSSTVNWQDASYTKCLEIIIIIIIILYHDFLPTGPTPRKGSHVKSDKTHTQSSRYTP